MRFILIALLLIALFLSIFGVTTLYIRNIENDRTAKAVEAVKICRANRYGLEVSAKVGGSFVYLHHPERGFFITRITSTSRREFDEISKTIRRVPNVLVFLKGEGTLILARPMVLDGVPDCFVSFHKVLRFNLK